MAAFSPDFARALPASPWVLATVLALALAAGAPAFAQQEEILLEAASSDFDRRGERLLFRDVRIQQGDIVITAAEAETRDLEFSSGAWEFRGDARIEGPMGSLLADRATVSFSNHQLRMAVAEGTPAEFNRTMPGPEARRVNGTANRISYDLAAGELALQGQARLTDGVREASGARLVYRITEDRLIATADESGTERVRIIITPPEDEDTSLPQQPEEPEAREPEPTP